MDLLRGFGMLSEEVTLLDPYPWTALISRETRLKLHPMNPEGAGPAWPRLENLAGQLAC